MTLRRQRLLGVLTATQPGPRFTPWGLRWPSPAAPEPIIIELPKGAWHDVLETTAVLQTHVRNFRLGS